jgi:hypothetical protein
MIDSRITIAEALQLQAAGSGDKIAAVTNMKSNKKNLKV